ncbi:MAG: hypothetical protein JWQ38_2580 [Flavipsychrobacter sp.]|nr:hypothetical protein [Flavipsychrobacter sp.]
MFSHITFARFLCVLILATCVHSAKAQVILTGTVTDRNGTGVPYASAILQHLPDSAILETAVADSMGDYRMDIKKFDRGLITISAMGYLPATKLIATPVSQQINTTLEQDNRILKEVSVSGKKPLIERKVDRVVFNVENSISAIGSDALEAISKAPGVHVSNADDISIVGKNTVSVMIDDKLQQLGGNELAEMLRSIPSSDIARIEVITTPPAKYDAAGNSGMINIVTRKQKKQGLNGTAGVTYMQNHFSSALPSLSLNYRKNKLNIYGHTNFGDNFSRPVETYTSGYPNQRWAQVNNIENLHNFHYSQLGIDYNITPKAIIGILYTYAGSTPRRNEDITGRWINNSNDVDSIINTKAQTHDFGERNVVNVNYEWKIDSAGKKLNMDGDFFTRTGRTVRDFRTINMYEDGSLTGINSTNRSTGKQVLYIGSGKADMELPTKFAKLSFGGKASFIHVISDNVFEYMNAGSYLIDLGKTNKFDYSENTEALYLSGQKKLNTKWDAQAGLRAEYTQTKAVSLTLAAANETRYLQFFPTGYLQYTINEDNVFNLNYSRRIDRPNMGQINPFRTYLTPNSYAEGNPFLQPSFTSNLELSYTLRSKYTFSVYTQQTQQLSTQILKIDSVNRGYYFSYANIGTSLNYGITASAALTPTKWWECNTQFYGFHAHVNANYYNTAVHTQYDLTGFVLENDNTFTLNKKKTFLAECGFSYNSTMIQDFNYHYPNYNINAGVKMLFLQRNLIIGINVNDIFRTEIIKARNLYNDAVTNNYYDERAMHMNITYKFGNKNVKSKRDRNGGATEESRRM